MTIEYTASGLPSMRSIRALDKVVDALTRLRMPDAAKAKTLGRRLRRLRAGGPGGPRGRAKK